jgi:putative ABC transport system permease protein
VGGRTRSETYFQMPPFMAYFPKTFMGLLKESLTTLRLQVRALVFRRRLDRDLQDELQFHLAMREQNVHRRETTFGNPIALKERSRDLWTFVMLDTTARDIRYGLRMLMKNAGFTAAAIATIALGIGANTAIFSVIRAVLFHSLTYPNVDRLVVLHEALPQTYLNVSWPDFVDWRSQNRVFDEIAAYAPNRVTITGSGEPDIVPGALVSPDIFPLLGARPMLGRVFAATDDQPSAAQTAVVSYEFWETRLHSDGGIIGKTIMQDKFPVTVVGVLSQGFRLPNGRVDIYNPIGLVSANPEFQDRGNHPGIVVFARLRPGVTAHSAEADMAAIMRRLGIAYPKSNANESATIIPLYKEYLGDFQRTLALLAGAAALVLLLACANVANLLLARGVVREAEFGIRAALGAARARLVRQSLTESVLISLLGGAAGLLLGGGAIRLLLHIAPASLPNLSETQLDASVLLFALGASFLTAMLFGLAPAVRMIQASGNSLVRESKHRLGTGPAHSKLRSGLMVSQVAIAVVVVVGSLLLVRSLIATLAVNPGFAASGLLALEVNLSGPQVNDAYNKRFFSDALERVRAVPGVHSADAVMCPPLQGACMGWTTPFSADGRPEPPETQKPWTFVNIVTPGYFQTMQIPLLSGRYFTPADDGRAPVVIVNRILARKLYPDGNAVGKRMQTLFGWLQIAGIASDVKQFHLASFEQPELYLPAAQVPLNFMTIVVRTSVDPAGLAQTVKAAIHSVDPTQPVTHVMPVTGYIDASLDGQRFSLLLLGTFGALSLILAAVGVYGVSAYNVSQRTQEFGLRMALGAQPRDIMTFALARLAKLVLSGLVIGLAGAPLLTRFLTTQLYGVTTRDPLTFAAAALVLGPVALLACYIPARRAARVDAMESLRHS